MEEEQINNIDISNIDTIITENNIGDTEIPLDTEEINQIFNAEPVLTSKDFLVNSSSIRFSGASWYEDIKKKRIILAGIGGIGSWTAFLIARLGIENLMLYDNDKVEEVNIAGQLFSMQQVHKQSYKTNAICATIKQFSDFYSYYSVCSLYTEYSATSSIMICGFDNMEARKVFYDNWKRHNYMNKKSDTLFIDGRMAAEEFQIFCIRGDDTYNMQRYEKEFLFPSSEAEPTICSYKQTSFMSSMIASFINNLVVNFVNNTNINNLERVLPFYTNYTAENFLLITEN